MGSNYVILWRVLPDFVCYARFWHSACSWKTSSFLLLIHKKLLTRVLFSLKNWHQFPAKLQKVKKWKSWDSSRILSGSQLKNWKIEKKSLESLQYLSSFMCDCCYHVRSLWFSSILFSHSPIIACFLHSFYIPIAYMWLSFPSKRYEGDTSLESWDPALYW